MSETNEWVRVPEHPGYRVKTIKRGECTIQILRPDLDEREQKEREARAKRVAERILKDYYIRKEAK